jgi:hypothetical protein
MGEQKSAEEVKDKNLVAVIRKARLSLDIRSESDGRGIRYYFNHPTLMNSKGTRAKKMGNPSLDVVRKWAVDLLEDLAKDQKTLTRKEFIELEDYRKRLERAEAELSETGLSLEMFLGQLLPALRRLPPEVLPSTVVDRGLAHFVPKNPMTVEQVIYELHPTLQTNALSRHTKNLLRNCGPLLSRHGKDWLHKVGVFELENLQAANDRGEFVAAKQKEKLLARRLKELKDPAHRPEILSIYHEKTREHFFDAWRRIFLRGYSRGAWPTDEALPTEVMERPDAGNGDGPVISVPDWRKLLPLLDPVERLLAALLIADMRAAEIDRSKTSDMVVEKGMPKGINVPPADHAKEKGGRFASFCPPVQVLVASCMPSGEYLLPSSANEIMTRIYLKAEANGIALDKNCIRRCHDTYWYGLKGGTKQLNKNRSHSGEMTDQRYRRVASVEMSADFYRSLPPDIPPHHRKWALDWVDDEVRGMIGSEPPDSAPEASPQGDSSPAPITNSSAAQTEPSSTPNEASSAGSPLITAPAELSGGTTNDPQEVQPEPGSAGVNGHCPEAGTRLPERALLPSPAPPSVAGSSYDLQKIMQDLPRRPDGKVAWTKLPREILIDLFSKYTPAEIAKAWSITIPAVYQQTTKLKAAASHGTTGADAPNSTSDAGSGVTRAPVPNLCLVKPAAPSGDNPGDPKQAEPKHGGAGNKGNCEKPVPALTECADLRPKPPAADAASLPAGGANNGAVQQTIPEPRRRADGKVDWIQLSQEFLIDLFSTHTPVEVAQAWSITRPAVYQQIRKLKLAAAHCAAADAPNGASGPKSALGQAAVSRRSPILPNVGRARITWPSSKADFLQDLWDLPATHIAKRLECSQSMVFRKADEWDLPRPGPGYFQRKREHTPVEMSQKARERLAELRAEEAAAKKRPTEESSVLPPPDDDGTPAAQLAKGQPDDKGQPNAEQAASVDTGEAAPSCALMAADTPATLGIAMAVETPAEVQPVAQVAGQDGHLITPRADHPALSGDGRTEGNDALRQPSPARTSRFKAEWPPKAKFLEMLWQMPATKIGERFGVSDVAVAKRAKALGLEIPGHSYRTKMARGGQVEMPEHIQQELQRLRREEDAATAPVLVSTVADRANPASSASIEPQTPTTAVESGDVSEPAFPTVGSATAGPSQPQRDFVLFRPVPKHTFSHTSSNGDSHPDPDSTPQTNINDASYEKSKS